MPLSSILRELDLIPTSLPPAVHLHVHGLPVPMPASPVPNRKCVCLFPTLQVDSSPSEPPGKPKNSGMGSLSLLQGKLLTQESNQGLLDCRWIIYQLSFPAQGLNPALGAWSLSHWTTREVPLHVFLEHPCLHPHLGIYLASCLHLPLHLYLCLRHQNPPVLLCLLTLMLTCMLSSHPHLLGLSSHLPLSSAHLHSISCLTCTPCATP